MKMFLTRFGERSRMVVTGDLSQIDLPSGARSGLRDAIDVLSGVDGVGFVHFTDNDVVRHTLVTRIVRAYDRKDRNQARAGGRSEQSRVGKEWVSRCRAVCWRYHKQINKR